MCLLLTSKQLRVDLLQIEVLQTHLRVIEYGGEADGPYKGGGDVNRTPPFWRLYINGHNDAAPHAVRVMRSASRIAAYVKTWHNNYVRAHGASSWAGAKLALF